LAPRPSLLPVSKLDRRHTYRETEKEKQLADGTGGRGAELYGCKKAWSSINHSILSGRGYCRLCEGMAEYSFSYRHSDKTLISCLLYIYIPVCSQLLIKAAAVAHLFRNTHGGESWHLCVQHASVGVLKEKCAQPSSTMPRHPSGPPTTWCRRRRAARRRRRNSPCSQFGLPRYLYGDGPDIQMGRKKD
jgi:hypothetical protein